MAGNRGRPRSFNKEKTLEQALGLFWKCGYLGTSYSDLCAETGLTKPSLYAAYGNKEETFLAALDLYVSLYVQPGIEALESEPDVREAIRKLLVETVKGLTAEGTPPGCMIATNAACIEAPDISQTIADAIKVAAGKTPQAIATCLAKAEAAGQIPPNTNISALTAFYGTLITGLSGLAKQGTPQSKLMQAVDTAMLVWPSEII
ncbi:Transcriptional regulator, IclR family [hydrothermal vent metagenome]|uniref:Transcriptional regulator, IclR family n=1 Tax=hydrothermal vent metagenome TaxID=652676 RepID=A0A3B0SHT2_9ZZZZ